MNDTLYIRNVHEKNDNAIKHRSHVLEQIHVAFLHNNIEGNLWGVQSILAKPVFARLPVVHSFTYCFLPSLLTLQGREDFGGKKQTTF